MTMLTITEIRNDHDLDLAMARIEELFDSPVGTPEGDELDAFVCTRPGVRNGNGRFGVNQIQSRPSSTELDQQGLTEADLVPIIGNPDAVSELLAGKRKITKRQGEALHELLACPYGFAALDRRRC